MDMEYQNYNNHHVVIVGGGFGGLYAAKALRKSSIKITLVDKRNFHLFQPLLYQVATGELSPGDIASPLRAIFAKSKNINVLASEMIDLDPHTQKIILNDGNIDYDTLILATGVEPNYFGHDDWNINAPGLKTIEDALEIRGRILYALETAEKEKKPSVRKSWLTYVVIGGGATGVELTGAIAELAFRSTVNDFRNFNKKEINIILVEAADRLLSTYHESLSSEAERSLTRFGVNIKKNTMVTAVENDRITITSENGTEDIFTRNVIWTAGIKANSISKIISQKSGAQLDRNGRIIVNKDLSVSEFKNIFVIGDLAHISDDSGKPLPGIAPVAIQEGRYIAKYIQAQLSGENIKPFVYKNKGMLAVVSRNAAIADFGWLKFSGFVAWFLWIFTHILYLIEFDNKFIVMFQWAWNYFTNRRGTRLITGKYAVSIKESELNFKLLKNGKEVNGK